MAEIILNGVIYWDTEQAAAFSGRKETTVRWHVHTNQLLPDANYKGKPLFLPRTVKAFYAAKKSAGRPKRKDMRRKENKA